MGFNPAENVDATDANSKAFSEFYEKKTGVKIKTFVASDYTALIEALRAGRIDFAWLPPFSFIKAEQLADAKVLLKAVRKGRANFYSCIITRTDSGIKTVADLKGKNMAWVDPTSTSGHIFPKANLMSKFNIADPDKYFHRQLFAGAHDTLVLSILNKTVDAGATFCNDPKGEDGAWHQFLKTAEEKAKIRVVYVTDAITGDTMATTNKFANANPAKVKTLTDTLVDMGNTKEGKEMLMALYRMEALVPAKSSDYDAVRNAAKVLKID
jgi:phosphonate transport system substrate-binding protein